MNRRKPNTFIIGAPKAGTTFVSNVLAAHPHVFVSDPKEIFFFDTDVNVGQVKDLEKYLRIFEPASSEERVLVDASTTYLFSSAAVPSIEKFNPNSKYVVLLRNPIDMAISLHSQLVWDGLESISEFEAAWSLRHARKPGAVGRRCTDLQLLNYEDQCQVGKQLHRLLETVGRDRVHAIFFDDIAADSDGVIRDLCDFLGLDHYYLRKEVIQRSEKNARRAARIQWLRTLSARLGDLKSNTILAGYSFGLLKKLDLMNSKKAQSSGISPELRNQMFETFRADVDLLSSLTGRDLSRWTLP